VNGRTGLNQIFNGGLVWSTDRFKTNEGSGAGVCIDGAEVGGIV